MGMRVEPVDYSVLLKKEMIGPIVLGRGLRQVDPLSPYLFNICVEGLSPLVSDAEERNTISGTKVCRGSSSVSHLLFTNDCFLFFIV